MAYPKKVYDYNREKTARTLVSAIKRRKNESTVADLVSATGLPKYQVEESLKKVLNEYAGHMKVTESGEILYYFPSGMRNRTKGVIPALKRFTAKALNVTGKVLTVLFKVWIMVMLVGYFALFLVLLLLAMFASVAGGMSSRDNRSRSRGGGFGTFYLTTRVIELFIQLWLYSGMRRADGRRYAKKRGKPLHKSVFAFVFGDGDPNAGWEVTEKKAVIRFVQSHKGIITLDEFMTLTGTTYEQAQLLLNRYLLEYEGEPEVTPGGTLIYRFPELMRTRESAAPMTLDSVPEKELIPFNRNEKSTNTWIAVLNSVNILFGSFFLYYSFFAGQLQPARPLDSFYIFTASLAANIGNPVPILAIGLGLVPFVFSVFFYLVPAVRRWREKKKNEEIRRENFLKRFYRYVFRNPEKLAPEAVLPSGSSQRPAELVKFRDKAIKEVGTVKGVEVEEVRQGEFLYTFPEIKRERQDVEQFRNSIDLSGYSLGKTIFDSGE